MVEHGDSFNACLSLYLYVDMLDSENNVSRFFGGVATSTPVNSASTKKPVRFNPPPFIEFKQYFFRIEH